MLYAERTAVPGRWRGTGWIRYGLVWMWWTFETHVEAAVELPSSSSCYRGGHYSVLLFTDYFQGRGRWHERVGGNDGSERRDSTRESRRRKSERHRERHRDTETRNRRDTESRSRAWSIPVSLQPQPRRPRHCDDNDTTIQSMPCPCLLPPSATASIHAEAIITGAGWQDGRRGGGEECGSVTSGREEGCDGHGGPCCIGLHLPPIPSWDERMGSSLHRGVI